MARGIFSSRFEHAITYARVDGSIVQRYVSRCQTIFVTDPGVQVGPSFVSAENPGWPRWIFGPQQPRIANQAFYFLGRCALKRDEGCAHRMDRGENSAVGDTPTYSSTLPLTTIKCTTSRGGWSRAEPAAVSASKIPSGRLGAIRSTDRRNMKRFVLM